MHCALLLIAVAVMVLPINETNQKTMHSKMSSPNSSNKVSSNIHRTSSAAVVHKLCPAPGSRGETRSKRLYTYPPPPIYNSETTESPVNIPHYSNDGKLSSTLAIEAAVETMWVNNNPSKRRKTSSDDATPLQILDQPSWHFHELPDGPNDVVLGRGGKINALIGNKKFRYFVDGLRANYSQAKTPTGRKNTAIMHKITEDIVTQWRNLDPPGRFLKKSEDESNTWYDVGDEHARIRTAQLIRTDTLASTYAEELGTKDVEVLNACIESLQEKFQKEVLAAAKDFGKNQMKMKQMRDHIKKMKSLQKKSHVERGTTQADRSGGLQGNKMNSSWHFHELPDGPNDVVLGRGGKINALLGNQKFRYFVGGLKEYYFQATDKYEKSKITEDIVTQWRNLDPPGRFLQKSEDESNTWYDVGDEHARLKAGQLIRTDTLASTYAEELGTKDVEVLNACIQSLQENQTERRDLMKISKPPQKKSFTEEEAATDSDRSGGLQGNKTKSSWQFNTLPDGPNDVVLGRGGKINALLGNQKFRYFVGGLKEYYVQATDKYEKSKITEDIVTQWRNLDPPGRFLQKSEDETNTWYDVGDEHARLKAAQLIRTDTLASTYAEELGTTDVEVLNACIQSLQENQMESRDLMKISKSSQKESQTEEEEEVAKDSDSRSGLKKNNMKGEISSGNTTYSNSEPLVQSESKTLLSNPTHPLRPATKVAPRVAHLLQTHENQQRHSQVSRLQSIQISPPPCHDTEKSSNMAPKQPELVHQSIPPVKAKAQASISEKETPERQSKLKSADVSTPEGNPESSETIAKSKKLPKRWSKEEDSQLRQMVEGYISTNQKIKWVGAAKGVPTRNAKQCRERWLHHLQPGVNKSNFTLEEDKALLRFRQEGRRWNEIEKLMPGRNCNDVKNRWHRFERARKKLGKLGRKADIETVHQIVNGRGGMTGENNNESTSACNGAKVEENDDVTDKILEREDTVQCTEESTLSAIPEVGMEVRVRLESDGNDKNQDCSVRWGTIINVSSQLSDLTASMDIDELANIISSGRDSSRSDKSHITDMRTGSTKASVLQKFNVTIKYNSGATEDFIFPDPDIQLMTSDCTLTDEERALSNELLNLGNSLSMKETHTMKKNSDEGILRTNVDASQDSVPLETVRRLLLGDLDPVELAKSLLPSDEVVLVEKRWRKR